MFRITALIFLTIIYPARWVMADQEFSTAGLTLTVDDVSGSISHINVRNNLDRDDQEIAILTKGSLLSLDWQIRPSLIRNQITTREDGLEVLESHFEIERLGIIRRVQAGSSPYTLSLQYEITNTSRENVDLASMLNPSFYFAEGFTQFIDDGGGYGAWLYGYQHFFTSNDDDAKILDQEALESFTLPDQVQWLGWINRHYVMALKMTESKDVAVVIDGQTKNNGEPVGLMTPTNLILRLPQSEQVLPDQLQPAKSVTINFETIIAPKLRDQLSIVSPSLDNVVLLNLWDWFRSICFALWSVLSYLFKLTGSWGIAIILMALIVRIVITPITRVSQRYQKSAVEQQEKIRPMLKEIKENYKGIELSEQMVALYKREKYDQLAPFKGMLGLFVQIPILIALFNVLGEAPELSGQSFLWFDNLSLSDRLFALDINLPFFGAYFNLLPFLMAGVSVFSTFYAARTLKGKMPKTSLYGMSFLFFVMFYAFPSALVLYWLSSLCFQFLQQVIENKMNVTV